MAVVVREAIEDCNTGFSPPENKIIIVIRGIAGVLAYKAFALVGQSLDIPDAPRRP